MRKGIVNISVRALSITVAMTLASCSAITDSGPPMPDSVLVSVLAEMHIANARVSLGYEIDENLTDSILARYGVDEADFRLAIDYYVDHPDEYIELYTAVVEKINDERARF